MRGKPNETSPLPSATASEQRAKSEATVVGVGDGFATGAALSFHTLVLPTLVQTYVLEATLAVLPIVVHLAPALTLAAWAVGAKTPMSKTAARRPEITRPNLFIIKTLDLLAERAWPGARLN
jgi:hypothetical protein